MNTTRVIAILSSNNISSLNKCFKHRFAWVEIDAVNTNQYLPITRKVGAYINAVLSDAELLTEIAIANGSMHEVMNRVK